MTIEFLSAALMGISLLTGITTEAIKKILDAKSKIYSSNLLAVIVSVVISLAVSIGYVILKSIPFSMTLVVEILILAFLSFLVATMGYDKAIQTLKQITKKNNPDTKSDDDK